MRQTNVRFVTLLVAVGVLACATPNLAAQATADSIVNNIQSYFTSLNNGYEFLDFMMDAYQQGSTPRLIQSYGDGPGFCSCTAFTYDNDVAITAYLARGTSDDMARAQVIGNAILFAQQHDPYHDGRVREAYWPTSIAAPMEPIRRSVDSTICPIAAPEIWPGPAWRSCSSTCALRIRIT